MVRMNELSRRHPESPRVIRRRVHLRTEGWYFVFVITFVIGGSVLRNVNLLVALGGLMVAALVIHWQLVVRSLSGMEIIRRLPPRMAAGDRLEVEVSIRRDARSSSAWALNYQERIERLDPPDGDPAVDVKLLFPRIKPGETVERRYTCNLSRRGVYRFSKANVVSRFPFGLIEGNCFIDLPDLVVVYPRLGRLSRSWTNLIESGSDGQQTIHHRRGVHEDDFHALREWRTGDSRRWIHWRTTAKLGTLAVREFEQRRRCDVAILLDLWQPTAPSELQRAYVEGVVSFAATAIADLCRRGSSKLTVVIASQSILHRTSTTSSLFAQELLEHLAVCRGDANARLSEAADRLGEIGTPLAKTLVLSTRSQTEALGTIARGTERGSGLRILEQATWLSVSGTEFANHFTLPEEPGV